MPSAATFVLTTMPEVTTKMIAQLRGMTNAGMMDCKKALIEVDGDLDAAVDLLRKRGVATAAKKGMRDASEGAITACILPGAKVGLLVEVNCETDFVAKNEIFREYCERIARTLAENPEADLESLRTELLSKVRENIRIARHERLEVTGNGLVAAYIHTGAKVGVLVEVGAGKEATVANDQFKQVVKDITLQIAAASPVAVTKADVDPALIEKEKEIIANSDLVKAKPEAAVAKIVEGKIEKYYKDNCLLSQGFVKRNGEVSVSEYITENAKALEDEITVRRFIRFQVGEALAGPAA